MKIWFMSDIHLEFAKLRIVQIPEHDVLVLAGDIGPGMSGWRWAEDISKLTNKPILLVCGNHEFYSKTYSMKQLYAKMRSVENSNVILLQNNSVTIDGVRFSGGTWWTNYELNGLADLDMFRAPSVMNDFNWIDYGILNSRITPEDVRHENWETTDFLRTTIGNDPTVKDVVITHHAPCQLSVNDRYRGQTDNVYFTNTLDRDHEFPLPALWFHGHMHDSVDYMMGDCRVVANPRGYIGELTGNNSKNFDPMLIVEI